jgi:hypothetical protein
MQYAACEKNRGDVSFTFPTIPTSITYEEGIIKFV